VTGRRPNSVLRPVGLGAAVHASSHQQTLARIDPDTRSHQNVAKIESDAGAGHSDFSHKHARDRASRPIAQSQAQQGLARTSLDVIFAMTSPRVDCGSTTILAVMSSFSARSKYRRIDIICRVAKHRVNDPILQPCGIMECSLFGNSRLASKVLRQACWCEGREALMTLAAFLTDNEGASSMPAHILIALECQARQ
jgi:hypothetical protein